MEKSIFPKWTNGARQETGSGTFVEICALAKMVDGKLRPAEGGNKAIWWSLSTNDLISSPDINRLGISASRKPESSCKAIIDRAESSAKRGGRTFTDE